MNRRAVIAGLTLPFVACRAWAQQPTKPIVGLLYSRSSVEAGPFVAAFLQGLGEAGFIENRNIAIEYRWADDQYDRIPALVAGLVASQVTLIATNSTPGALAAKASSSSIPIIFTIGADPVALGLVASLARPGGNVTGVTSLASELGPKQLEVLRQIVPAARVFGLLVNPTSPSLTEAATKSLQPIAQMLGLELRVLHAATDSELEAAFSSMSLLKISGVVVGSDSFFSGRTEYLAALSLRAAMPTIYWNPMFAGRGGLVSYGTPAYAGPRQLGVLAGRILKGEKPSEMPVHQETKVDLVINLKTAKALGLTIPPTLLARADEVIE